MQTAAPATPGTSATPGPTDTPPSPPTLTTSQTSEKASGEEAATFDMRKDLVALMPNLRAFARSICGNATRADDLVQETLAKAWAKRDSFQPGTNLKAWLFTILRNTYLTEIRKRKREVEDADDVMANNMSVPASQDVQMKFNDLTAALQELSDDQREAVILVGAEGLSYEEAAEICDCAVGTVKSRVNRARARLSEIMDDNDMAA